MFSFWLAVLVGGLAYVYCSATCAGTLSASEYNALEAFFTSTNGSEWIWNTSLPLSTRWNFPSSLSTPCSTSWQGLNCSYSGGGCVVTALSLSGYNLHGPIPPNIGNLSSIQSLNCSNNGLSGSIPHQLQQMVNLKKLDLSSNELIGSIPPLTPTMTALHLNSNHLTGSLPTELGQMTLMIKLILYSNSLVGLLPTELGQMISLTQLNLNSNSLTGSLPTELGQIKSLVKLDLNTNRLTSSLPTELGQLTSLTQLLLKLNNLTGSLPTELGQIKPLTKLDLNTNSLTGSLPTELCQLKSLTQLDLQINSLTGSLPTELGQMKSLTQLDLQINHLTGLLPTELGQMTSLTVLNLFNNRLTGSLPTEFSQMESLIDILLYSNRLSGSLPTELGQIKSLTQLNLQINRLTGSLPTELGQMTLVAQLYLQVNRLTGSLPTELGQMISLTQLYLKSNSLTGSLPTELIQMTSLTQLDFSINRLKGSLPTELGQMTLLTKLYLQVNHLTGSLSTELGQMTSLTQLDLTSNSLTGSLPTELGQMTSLTGLYLPINSLTGSTPTELGQMTSLIQLDLSSNSLTGSLPTELGQMTSLTLLYLPINSLTGSIPTELGQITSLTELELYSNLLTGLLPPELQNCLKMNSLSLFSNKLSGHISIEIIGLNKLRGLDLHCNYFSSSLPSNTQPHLEFADMSMNMLTGSMPLLGIKLESYNMSFNLFDGGLDLLFNSSTSFKKLVLLDVSHNLLSGPLPSQWTSEVVPSLQTLLLSSNCFSNSISSSFAQLPNLRNLILDAYGSAPGCSVKVPSWLKWLVKGLFKKQGGGTYSLPSEIVQMPRLLTLHAAGNALTGVLSELLAGSSLIDVSLANNKLEGTIPESWQTHGQFIQLDLSCNKLSGVLSSELVVPLLSNSSISLPNGSSIGTVFDLSVNRLSGTIPSSLYTAQGLNILDGNLFQCQEAHMPEHDASSKVTVCGSDTMNLSFYMWLGMLICVLSLIVWFRRLSFQQWDILQRDDEAVEFLSGVKLFCRLSVASAAISLLVLLTAYVLMKTIASSEYSTHLYQYGWVTTAAYLHGALPSGLVVISVLFVSLSIFIVIYRHIAETANKVHSRQWMKVYYLKISGILLCHMVVTVTLNVLYVLAVLVGLPSSQLTLVQVAFGGFKLLWNSVYIGWSIKRLPFLSSSGRLKLSSSMKIFSFLVSPYVATFFSDSTCFRYVITGNPVVDASFAALTFNCHVPCNTQNCISVCGMDEVSLIYTSTSPPWLYSFQCSSALLTNYIPVLVISYLMSGLFIPALVTAYSLHSEQFINSWMSPLVYDKFLKHSVYDYRNGTSDLLLVESPKQEYIKPLFKSYDIVSKLILNLAVMLTFGFAAPLLAVIVAVDSYSTFYMWRLLINRFMFLNKTESSDGRYTTSPQALARLESATADSFAGLRSCWLLALVSVAFFWSIFVFDMVGDVYGAEVGGLSVLGPSLSLLCVCVVPVLLRKFRLEEINILSSKSCHVELNSV